MKRFMLFSGYNHYPSGGMRDFDGMFNTVTECIDSLGNQDWWNILDTVTIKVYQSHKVNGSVRDWAHELDAELLPKYSTEWR